MLRYESNSSHEAGPVFSAFGERSTLQLESARKTIEQARKLCQASMMLRWESAELQHVAQEARQETITLCQEARKYLSTSDTLAAPG